MDKQNPKIRCTSSSNLRVYPLVRRFEGSVPNRCCLPGMEPPVGRSERRDSDSVKRRWRGLLRELELAAKSKRLARGTTPANQRATSSRACFKPSRPNRHARATLERSKTRQPARVKQRWQATVQPNQGGKVCGPACTSKPQCPASSTAALKAIDLAID